MPLKKTILLITSGDKYLCRVIHAGKEILTIVDVHERLLTPDGDFIYTDLDLSGKLFLDRKSVIGYQNLEEEKLLKTENEYNKKILKEYSNSRAEYKRKKFLRIINKGE